MHKDVGSTWVAPINDKQWPVVLCGDELAPPQFISKRTDPEHMPAIQLGRYKYVFVHDRRLSSFDPFEDYLKGLDAFPKKDIQHEDSETVKEEKQRRAAFREDAPRYKDHHFWANYITSQSKARKLERERGGPHTPQKQRSASGKTDVALDFSRGFEPAIKRRKLSHKPTRQLQTPTKTPRKPQYPKNPPTGVIEISDGEDESGVSDDDIQPMSTNGTFGKDFPRVVPSIENSDGIAKKARSTISDTLPGPDECVLVFAHGERSRLVVKRDMISKCAYLNNRKADDDSATELSLINDKRANDVKLTHSDLSAVLQYYQTGDIGPRFVNKPDQEPAVSRLDLSDNRKTAHVEALSKAFVTAAKIEDENLRSLIFLKLQALAPFSDLDILILARCVSGFAILATPGEELSPWVTDHVKKHYWVLAKNHMDLLQDTLEGNDVMRAAVYEYLRDNPKGGMERYGEDED